jgi:glycosyltransferase involved in cell wall biosynthesis
LIVGGAQENTLLTCEGLHRRGHDVTLITGPSPGPEGSLMQRAESGGYRVSVEKSLVRNPHPWLDYQALQRLKARCHELQPDIVHTHSSKAGIIGRAAAWRCKVPVIVHTIHGLPFHPYQSQIINAAWIFLERFAARRCHKIVSVADAMTRQALACGVGTPEEFLTIYSGMEIQPFLAAAGRQAQVRKTLGIPPESIVLGTIARLQPLKGHDDLLAIAGAVIKAYRNVVFLWIGDGIFRERFMNKISSAGWQNHFVFTGLVAPEQVPTLIPAMDILVHPSYREGLPRAVVQGMLEGVPAIAYNSDGAGEVCIQSQTGIPVPVGHRAALLEAIMQLIKNKELRHTLGENSKVLAAKRFDADRMVEQLLVLYQQLQGERRGA